MTHLGHEDSFPRRRLNGPCRLNQETFAGAPGNDEAAPKTDLRMLADERVKPTPN
jgi:hypothetical protein